MYIAITDYLLLIPYLAFFYFLAKRMYKKNTDSQLRKYFFTAFWLRMFGCILFSMVIQYYYGYGDPFTYYKGSNFFTERFSENVSNLRYLFAPNKEIADWYMANPAGDQMFAGYFSHPSGNIVMKITALLSYVSFNRFLIISLFFGFFSFVGQWKLFLVFDDINQNKRQKLLAFATLYTPSIWFWGSGLLKDSICLGSLGLIIHILYTFFIKKKVSPVNVLILLLLFYVVAIIKSYITNILLLTLAITMIMVFVKSIKNFVARIALVSFLLIAGGIVLSQVDFSEQLNNVVEEAVLQINSFQKSYQNASEEAEDAKGGFSIKEIDPTLQSIVLRAPAVIFTCLYRPFIWESRKIMILFTSLESMLLLYCSLYLLFKTKVKGFFSHIFSDKYLFFCFILSMLFAMIIGFTTFNFGTMIRYKIIFLPFFYFLLVRIFLLSKGKAGKEDVPGGEPS